jgi:hypothetical protein
MRLPQAFAGVLLFALSCVAGPGGGQAHAAQGKKQGQEKSKGPKGKAQAQAKTKTQRKGPLLAQVSSPPSIDLVDFDLAAGVAHVSVGGSARAPEGRLFAFQDDRKRRFVPTPVSCQPEQAQGERAGRWACTLGIPRIYQRLTVVGLTAQVRGQTVAVPGDKVQEAWQAARAHIPLPAAERPRDPAVRRRGVPDGGPTVEPEGEGDDPEGPEG